jgi:predicted acylesterase/phospholipase RssA
MSATPGTSVEEVRVAMALNGGVSLAVWMGGCAVELDAARRAHLGAEDLRVASEPDAASPDAAPSAPPPPGDARTIYHALCEAFERELVIDLMSGSSAGGINGALLAAAIDGRRRLHPDYIREKWLRLGDLETLLHPLRTASPTSLMGGHLFFVKLRRTFEELLPTKELGAQALDLVGEERAAWDRAQRQLDLPANQRSRDAELVRTVALDITATDVTGREQRFRDTWGEELVATEYRQRFHFRGRGDYTAQRLAMAARASASFPLAFEPWAVDGKMLDVEGRRWLIDGGLLDNAPIRAVLDLIPARVSERPVRRFLCYLNADPPLTPTFDPDAELRDANDPAVDAGAGDAARKAKPGDSAARPQLQDVVAYMIGLPRKASFVDQLRAIQRAASRSTTVDSGERSMLALDEDCLAATAGALLPAYRSRRRLHSLEEMLEQPADVTIAAERMARLQGELPWIPTALEVPDGDRRWGWGARAASRVLYLVLDFIRPQIAAHSHDGDLAPCRALMAARRDIYAGLATLDGIHAGLVADPKIKALMTALTEGDEAAVPSTLCALGCLMEDPARDPTIRGVVECAAATAFGVRAELGTVGDASVARALFGPGADAADTPFGPAQLRAFLRRTLWMEVVRRAFTADELVDSEQPLLFAQLTPCAPTLLYTPWPLHPGPEVPARPDDKLTGTRWGHFAAFYRASWRANDFMWGRLDAAVRIVDMLLPPEAGDGFEARAPAAAAVLADALAPEEAFEDAAQGGERRWLVAEALADAMPIPEDDRHREHEWRRARCDELTAASRAELLERLTACIEQDLTHGIDGHPRRTATRALCVRAAQWEILRRELPHVIATSKQDRSLGTSVRALDVIPAKGESWRQGIEALRKEKAPLPERLGVDDKAEQASALMIRTASHGALIGLSALRESGLPGSPAFLVPRALLLPIAGVVARKTWPYPFAVALAFWSFALVVAARLITLEPGGATAWGTHRWLAVVTTWLAAAGVTMVWLVPFWRVVRSRSWRGRIEEGAWLIALVVAGGAVGIALALRQDRVGVVNLVAQTGSEPPWDVGAGLALVVVGVFRFVPRFVPSRARQLAASLLHSAWKGPLSLAVFLIPWLLLGGWAILEFVWQAAWGGAGAWSTSDEWTARIAVVAPGLVAFAYALFSVQRRAGTVLDAVRGLRG